jgi:hypothetical protein
MMHRYRVQGAKLQFKTAKEAMDAILKLRLKKWRIEKLDGTMVADSTWGENIIQAAIDLEMEDEPCHLGFVRKTKLQWNDPGR